MAVKGKRIISPAELQQLLEQLHSSHIRKEKKGLRKRNHILDKNECSCRKQCKVLLRLSWSSADAAKTGIIAHEKPGKPWKFIVTDLFTSKNSNFLLFCQLPRHIPDSEKSR